METRIRATLGDGLHLACENGDLNAICEYITCRKAEEFSYAPPLAEILYTATGKDRLNVIKYCLDNGAIVTDNVMKKLLICRAIVTDNVMKKLLICRAKEAYLFFLETNAVDVNYYIPWFGDILSNVARGDDIEWTKLCLAHGADPSQNLVDEHMSILAAVAELGLTHMVEILVMNGAQVKGSGAIVLAAQEGCLQLVEYLLDHGADIDEVGIEHPTDERFREDMGSALHRAAHRGHEDVVRLLLERGANVDLKDVMGRTPVELAQTGKHEKLEAMLTERATVAG